MNSLGKIYQNISLLERSILHIIQEHSRTTAEVCTPNKNKCNDSYHRHKRVWGLHEHTPFKRTSQSQHVKLFI